MKSSLQSFIIGALVLFALALLTLNYRAPAPVTPVPEISSVVTVPRSNAGQGDELVARWVSSRSPARGTDPQQRTSSQPVSTGPESVADILDRLDSLPRVTPEVLARYVNTSAASAESLLAAFAEDRDTNWVWQAVRDFPDDPRVQLQVLSMDLPPEERERWLESFKQSSPENSLANYLSAAHHFGAGHELEAMQELEAGNRKQQYSAHLAASMQNAEELYLEAGYTSLSAKAKAFMEIEFDHLPELRDFSKSLLSYREQLIQQGDEAAADQVAIMGVEFSQRLSLGDGNFTLLDQLVGLAMEESFLENLDGQRAYPGLPMPVPEMLKAIETQREGIKEASQVLQSPFAPGQEALLERYFDRVKVFGEYEAIQWLRRQ